MRTSPATQMPAQAEKPSSSKKRPRRPLTVTLLALGVLILSALNLIRLVEALRQWEFLAQLLMVSPLYLAATGLVWTLVGFPLALGLWRGLGWAARAARWATIAYLLYYWLDRIFVANRFDLGYNTPFALGASLVALAFVYWVFSRQKARAFFGEVYEH